MIPYRGFKSRPLRQTSCAYSNGYSRDAGTLGSYSLIHTLYLVTPFQILYDVLESVVRFILPNLESFDIAGIFG